MTINIQYTEHINIDARLTLSKIYTLTASNSNEIAQQTRNKLTHFGLIFVRPPLLWHVIMTRRPVLVKLPNNSLVLANKLTSNSMLIYESTFVSALTFT